MNMIKSLQILAVSQTSLREWVAVYHWHARSELGRGTVGQNVGARGILLKFIRKIESASESH